MLQVSSLSEEPASQKLVPFFFYVEGGLYSAWHIYAFTLQLYKFLQVQN
jgi:hypothetical protein